MSSVLDETALINKLPEELLEKIFSFTSQYRDYANLSKVCTKWWRIIAGLRSLNHVDFNECFQTGQIYFKCFENKFAPMQRHSHSSCRRGDCLYVFGGLSGTSTSYNDLWQFDLSNKTWSRPNTNGSYPSPKAAASLISTEANQLFLYGGYSHPYSSFSQQVNFFDELHVYSVKTAAWSQIVFSHEAPKLAGHSASLLNNTQKMILFGGCNGTLGNKTNSVYCLDLNTYEWKTGASASRSSFKSREIDGFKPEARYGHSQVTLDEERVLIVGGCGGPNKQYDDVWILSWPKDDSLHAHWQQVIVNSTINSPAQIYCISFVRCDDKLITFGKPRFNNSSSIKASNEQSRLTPFSGLIGDEFKNKNSNQIDKVYTIVSGSLKQIQHRQCTCQLMPIAEKQPVVALIPEAISSNEIATSIASADNKLLNKTQRNTIKRLEALKKIATKFNKLKDEKEIKVIQQQLNTTASLSKKQNHCVIHSKLMQMFVLDIKQVLEKGKEVNWQTPIANFYQAPPDSILYSLTKGVDELILFGGMELESNLTLKLNYDSVKHRVSNKVYIMKPASLFITSS